MTGFTGARLQILKAGNAHQVNSADMHSDHYANVSFHNISICMQVGVFSEIGKPSQSTNNVFDIRVGSKTRFQ